MRLTPAQYAAVKALFETCLELPAAAREARIAQAALDEAALAELRSLLAHHDATAAPDLLDAPDAAQALAAESTSASDAAPPPERRGQRLGAWEITAFLGSGGMGEVWEARRADGQFEGVAAIKLLKRGMDSAAVLARFAQERNALARLSHPHIARLLDAGLSDEGLPFFVMERVDGRPIDRAAAGRPIAQRLGLFLQLADAVAHAHRAMLVHRDLKPGNVLVDAGDQVKLLDFGIAKALDPLETVPLPDAPRVDTTVAGQRPFTPHYASPEQVRGEPVTTATDIYSLGVLLYQLLTGARPTGRQASTPAEAARSVLEDEPTRPSRLSASDSLDPAFATTRRQLEGDLDNILLKALEKDPARRYASVDALRADVSAYLGGHPVSARAATRAYLWGKFVRRHRVSVSAAALAGLAVIFGGGAAAWQAQRAEAARAQAEQRLAQVRTMANELVFRYHDQIEKLPGAGPVREALLADAVRYLDGLRGEAAQDPRLARELAAAYYRVSLSQGVSQSSSRSDVGAAAATLAQALALSEHYAAREDTPLSELSEVADMWISQAEMRQRQGRLGEALASMARAEVLLDRALAREPEQAAALTSAVGLHGAMARMLGTSITHANLGRTTQALSHLDRALAHAQVLVRVAPGSESEHTLSFVLGERLNALQLAGRFDEAVERARELVARREAVVAREPDNMAFRYQSAGSRSGLAAALGFGGRHEEALRTMAEARALLDEAARRDAGNPAAQRNRVIFAMLTGRLHVLAGQMPQARPWLDQALAGFPGPATGDFLLDRWRADTQLWLARAWREADPAKALGFADEALAAMAKAGVPSSAASPPGPTASAVPARSPGSDENAARRWMVALIEGERALALQALGRSGEARAAAERAGAAWTAASPDGAVPGSLQRFATPVRALLGG